MITVINKNGDILATNQRDHAFLRLTILTDKFLGERKEVGLFSELGISQSCLLPAFVMWLKDNGLLTLTEKQ